jgi:hypothetical protein
MGVNDNACFLIKRVVLNSIASKLAPTEKNPQSRGFQAVSTAFFFGWKKLICISQKRITK